MTTEKTKNRNMLTGFLLGFSGALALGYLATRTSREKNDGEKNALPANAFDPLKDPNAVWWREPTGAGLVKTGLQASAIRQRMPKLFSSLRGMPAREIMDPAVGSLGRGCDCKDGSSKPCCCKWDNC